MNDRQSAPSVARNRGPLLEVLRRVLPPAGTVLEIASGSGEHAMFFAEHLPGLVFQPSDVDEGARKSIEAWRVDSGLANLRAPIAVDALTSEGWPEHVDALLCVNMIHISPWAATLGLFESAARVLPPGAPLVTYGPYRRADRPTAPSNETFDESLRSRNPTWGLRVLEDVIAVARFRRFTVDEIIEMPANNLTVVYRKLRSE